MHLGDTHVDETVVGAVGDDALEQMAGEFTDGFAAQSRQEDGVEEVAHLVVVEGFDGATEGRGRVGDDTLRIAGTLDPLTEPAWNLGLTDTFGDEFGREEVRADELLEALAELVLARRDDGGVRHLEAERVAEQRRHGEPVGDGTHHRGLGGGVDIAPDAGSAVRQDEDERRERQQARGHEAHAAQGGSALFVGFGKGEARRHPDRIASVRQVARRLTVLARESSCCWISGQVCSRSMWRAWTTVPVPGIRMREAGRRAAWA